MLKKSVSFVSLLIVTIALFFPGSLNAGNKPESGGSKPVKTQKGERPLPDFSKISDESLIPGLIRIKIKESFAENLKSTSLIHDGLSEKFGLPGIDRLNREAGVYAATRSFAIALRNCEYETRHHKWGLHLWYDLRVPSGTNLKNLRELYSGLPEVETAELLAKVIPSSTGHINSAGWMPNDSLFHQMWHYTNTGQSGGTPGADISLPAAWELERGDTAVIVAVMDAGVDWTHPDLLPNMWPGNGYNFFADTTWLEPCLHGTHVSGTIAASTNNNTGVSGIAGGDGSGNGVRIMSCQIISSQNTVVEENIPNAYIWAADHGAAISQNSWNYPVASPSMLDAIDYFIANGGGSTFNGGVVICSAGNDDTNHISYPCCYEPCLAVAATSDQDAKSFFSNYGPWVDLSAPGGNSITDDPRNILSTIPGPGYGWGMGTSMACPHVSGVAALVISHAKGMLVPDDVKEILVNSTDNIEALTPGYLGMLGSGRLNASRALLLTQLYMDPQIPRPPLVFTALGGENGQIDLAWTGNVQSDSLLLAYSFSPVFGVPAGSYQVGDTIGGGGTVLFKGKNTGFTHSGLDSGTVQHYRLWSLRNNRYSPFGRSAADTVKSSPNGILNLAGPTETGIRVTPNPADGIVSFHFVLDSPGEVRVLVSDPSGKVMSQERIYFNLPGEQKLVMDAGGWASGIYTVSILAGSRSFSGKLLVM